MQEVGVEGCRADTPRVSDLRARVRAAMERPPVAWQPPARLDERYLGEPLPIRRARAIAAKLAAMPVDLWPGQLLAGSMTLEEPRLHAEWGQVDWLTPAEREAAGRQIYGFRPSFGHIVPDYPKLLRVGLRGLIAEADERKAGAAPDEVVFLDSVIIACEGVIGYAARLAESCRARAAEQAVEASDLLAQAASLDRMPAAPAETFHQAVQSVWLLHLVYHCTGEGNALGRADQYLWPYLRDDLAAGRLTESRAAELVDCFCLKFNERAVAQESQLTASRSAEEATPRSRTRHGTSSQLGTRRDGLDAANHWLQNIVIGGLTPAGEDGTNPLTHLLLDSYHRHQMTNPLLTARLHRDSPDAFVEHVAEVLKAGGGMPAIFSDEALVPALCRLGIPLGDSRDYTNDGCWEVIIPGRTDFCFQRLSLMLCLERALGLDDDVIPAFARFDDVWDAWAAELDAMVAGVVDSVLEHERERARFYPTPLLSALIDGTLERRRDLAAGGAKHRTYGMLAESASHCIDSLVALQAIAESDGPAGLAELRAAVAADFEGHERLRSRVLRLPKYGNDDPVADDLGRRVMSCFVDTVRRHAGRHESRVLWPCGAASFSWYIGIGEGLRASPDGRRSGEPVASNFSPALGRDRHGLASTVLSYAAMPHDDLPAGGPLDLRLPPDLVSGAEGTARLAAILRGFVESGGSMLTVTVADTALLRAAQAEPEKYGSLRVRMGGWCAYFTLLSPEQQEHQIRRQEQLG